MILFKPIKPRKPFQSSIYRTEIKEASQKIAKGIEKDFAKTYRTWKHKPKFKTTIEGPGTKGVSITVATEDEIYAYVDQGTKKHAIFPRHKKALAWPKGRFVAKTTPNLISSKAGVRPSGKKKIVRKGVMHPGTQARNFSKLIAAKWKPEFNSEMSAALKRFSKRVGSK